LTEIVDVEALCALVMNADEWNARQVQECLAQSPVPFVLDVREAHEYAVSHLHGAVRIGVDDVGRGSKNCAQPGGKRSIYSRELD